ncbi:MAG: phage major capsid protein [Candidatus Poribacteria bacterium]|nr:phage major capsid protein [Candidatus Poribacteria bacterium]
MKYDFSLSQYAKAKIDKVEYKSNAVNDSADLLYDSISLRALTAGTEPELIDKNVDGSEFNNFYSQSVLLRFATVISGLKTSLVLTKKTQSGTLVANAVGENAANIFSPEQTGGSVTLNPKFIRVSIDVSKTLIMQSSRTLDQLLITELRDALTEELERQLFKGTSSNEITGIFSTANVSKISWAGFATLTGDGAFDKLTAAEKTLGEAKVPPPFIWTYNSASREHLRKLGKHSEPLLKMDAIGGARMLGYRGYSTEQMTDDQVYLLNPSYLIIGIWNESRDERLEVFVDPYTKSNQGLVSITGAIYANAALIKPESCVILHA